MLDNYKYPSGLLCAPNIPFRSECQCISGKGKKEGRLVYAQRGIRGRILFWNQLDIYLDLWNLRLET